MSRKDLEELRERVEKMENRVVIMETTHTCSCGHTFYSHPHYTGTKCIALDMKTGKQCVCQGYKEPPAPAPEEEREPGNEEKDNSLPPCCDCVRAESSCGFERKTCEARIDARLPIPYDPDDHPSHPDTSYPGEDVDVNQGDCP